MTRARSHNLSDAHPGDGAAPWAFAVVGMVLALAALLAFALAAVRSREAGKPAGLKLDLPSVPAFKMPAPPAIPRGGVDG